MVATPVPTGAEYTADYRVYYRMSALDGIF